jgi:hypothetical protein
MSPVYLRHRAGFAEALDARFFTIEWLDGQVEEGLINCFGNNGAAILVKIVEYPTGARVVRGVYATGDLAAIKELIPAAEAWGAQFGATFAKIDSRPAWAKILPDYHTYKVEILKELKDG